MSTQYLLYTAAATKPHIVLKTGGIGGIERRTSQFPLIDFHRVLLYSTYIRIGLRSDSSSAFMEGGDLHRVVRKKAGKDPLWSAGVGICLFGRSRICSSERQGRGIVLSGDECLVWRCYVGPAPAVPSAAGYRTTSVRAGGIGCDVVAALLEALSF
jgi:hypothetical protein